MFGRWRGGDWKTAEDGGEEVVGRRQKTVERRWLVDGGRRWRKVVVVLWGDRWWFSG
ncbi:hypothetical protein HanRHA438_Chr10g0459151 [Helianthus annuus]|uniref:Uncharacterized protein n=1 Tax=Helianthus annuus TaxID=4232 RepID=A0A9K3N4C4_HELAN|nr:hypothetical protein HanXRQr2_Chr10g0446591 [Helianthus annuus]KAJ0522325.1 hypothetical protein HanIR_Chr10g0481401 [Helianthus annuus]KAJ0880082.1 hypothetical protein HanRHA438_Chr10g0459151 [Helianthus annuus]